MRLNTVSVASFDSVRNYITFNLIFNCFKLMTIYNTILFIQF